MPANHPMDRLSICGFDYAESVIYDDYLEKNIEKKPFKQSKGLPIIGNDVWIGHNVVLARGIKIGNGAVIGAYSIVTKDVPDYAIVAGVPATIKKFRFSQDIRNKLSCLKWWEYDLNDIVKFDTTNIEEFIDSFEYEISENNLKKKYFEAISLHKEFQTL